MTKFCAFVFLLVVMVSALATHINAEPTGELVVHHACEGETFCAVKPENYPQEEIDRILLRHLPHLNRMKREKIEPAPPNPVGNCLVTDSEMIRPFTLKRPDALPQLIVQSKWFDQKVPRMSCRNEKAECFSLYKWENFGSKAQCMTKKLAYSIIVYDTENGKFEKIGTEVDIDCVCVIKFE